MSHFREVFRCKNCGRIYRSSYCPNMYAIHSYDAVCGRCGSKNNLEPVVAKPKLFGLKGWEIKGGENE